MQFPMLTASEMDVARVHRHNPHDLHWRKDPPAWPGRVDSAYRRLYPHLVDEFCCMQCGAIPCPFDHAEDRDTRLQDMSFVGDIVREKKELETQISQLRGQLNSSQQAERKWIVEKQTFQKHVYELETANKKLDKDKIGLLQDLSRLRATRNKLQQEIHCQKKELEQIPILEQELSRLKEEWKELSAENDLQKRLLSRQNLDSSSLTVHPSSEREKLIEKELEDLRKNFEQMLASRVQAVEEERLKAENELTEKCRQLEELRRRLAESEENEFKSMNAVLDLHQEMEKFRAQLDNARILRDALEKQIRGYVEEIDRLKRKLDNDRGFQRYVGVLRELNRTKESNDDLRLKLEEKPKISLTALTSKGQRRRAYSVVSSSTLPSRTTADRNNTSSKSMTRTRSCHSSLLAESNADQ